MNILMIASEAAPYFRTGDVANVVTGLSVELLRKGHHVSQVLPHYRGLVLDGELTCLIPALDVSLASYRRSAMVRQFNSEVDSLQLPLYVAPVPSTRTF